MNIKLIPIDRKHGEEIINISKVRGIPNVEGSA